MTKSIEEYYCVGKKRTVMVRKSKDGNSRTPMYSIHTYTSMTINPKLAGTLSELTEEEFIEAFKRAKTEINKITSIDEQ